MLHHENAAAESEVSEKKVRPQASRAARAFWYSLLVLFGIVSIWWPLYNKVEPRLGGIPFFLWFQFVWISLSAVATALAYKARA